MNKSHGAQLATDLLLRLLKDPPKYAIPFLGGYDTWEDAKLHADKYAQETGIDVPIYELRCMAHGSSDR